MPASYNAVPSVATGDWITAGWVNTYIGGNMSALFPYTTQGDIAYANTSSELARLAAGANGESIVYASGVPTTRKPKGVWDDWGTVERTSAAKLTNTSWADLSSFSITLTLTRTCTIHGAYAGTMGADSAGSMVNKIRMNIDGNTPTTEVVMSFGGVNTPAAARFSIAGIAAGSRVVKLQNQLAAGSGMYVSGILDAWAVVE